MSVLKFIKLTAMDKISCVLEVTDSQKFNGVNSHNHPPRCPVRDSTGSTHYPDSNYQDIRDFLYNLKNIHNFKY